ncbi:MgtC/SapB family protein [Candidatus Altiarchaeota archaeon]
MDYTQFFPYLQLTLAAGLGFIVGLERKFFNKHVGPRTYSLISLGACVFTILSMTTELGFQSGFRIAAQIVTGIGFLGAGVIWKSRDHVLGITTAASIWVVASIGMLIGFGFIGYAFYTTLLIVFILHAKGMPGWSRFEELLDS